MSDTIPCPPPPRSATDLVAERLERIELALQHLADGQLAAREERRELAALLRVHIEADAETRRRLDALEAAQ